MANWSNVLLTRVSKFHNCTQSYLMQIIILYFRQSMQKQLETLHLIISGRYSRTSSISEAQQHARSEEKLHSLSSRNRMKFSRLQKLDQRKDQIIKNQAQLKHSQVNHSTNQKITEEDLQKSQADVRKMLSTKYKTFMKWNYRQSLPKNIRIGHSKDKKDKQHKNEGVNNSSLVNFSVLMKNEKLPKPRQQHVKTHKKSQSATANIQRPPSFQLPTVTDHPSSNEKAVQQTAQMLAIKQSRRQRFMKLTNPLQFLKHYVEKQSFTPTPQQKHLIQKLISIQKSIENEMIKDNSSSNHSEHFTNVEAILESLYKLMNLAVDYNELTFLALLVCLAGDVCYFINDHIRAFYFYNQTRLAATYAHMDKIKIPALMGLGRVCFQLRYFDYAKRLYRKTLQYAWRIHDENAELQVYDSYGQIYNQKGKVRQSLFYHEKFAKNLLEPSSSALRKISNQMLAEHDRHIKSLEDSSLTSLFLEYVHLPINGSYQAKTKNAAKRYSNYDNLGQSPRMNKQYHDFHRESFPSLQMQLKALFQQDYEFRSEIPDPDKPGSRQLNRLINKSRKDSLRAGGTRKHQIQFIHSIEFNKILNKKPEKPNVQNQLKRSLEQQVQMALQQRLDPEWYENMVADIKKKRQEKVGSLKQRVRNSHLSYGKYPSERKRQSVWSTEKINQSFNRTLLDWIDPVQ